MKLGSLPALLGPERAARLACWIMAVPQAIVIGLMVFWERPIFALIVSGFLLAQLALMRRLLGDPKARAPWYNGTGIVLYVSGMLATAFALRSMGGM